MSKHFTIVIPSYNCRNWVQKNLNSACHQEYDNFDVVYIDDASTDGTTELVREYKDKDNLEIIINPFNKGKMENLFNVVNAAKDDTIILILDGDDWLSRADVLKTLNEVYKSDDVWMTNGSYVIDSTGEVVTPRIDPSYWEGGIRKKSWELSHLGTFRKKLFCKIKRKDLMNKQGEFWSTTSDQAAMWPMAEMAGPEHFRALKNVLYVYNRLNPLSDDRAHRQDQLITEQIIRNKKPYSRLERL